jgi:hypothetical protein
MIHPSSASQMPLAAPPGEDQEHAERDERRPDPPPVRRGQHRGPPQVARAVPDHGAQHAPAVEGIRGQQVEHGEHQVHEPQPARRGDGHLGRPHRVEQQGDGREPDPEHHAGDRPGERDPTFRPGVVGVTAQP